MFCFFISIQIPCRIHINYLFWKGVVLQSTNTYNSGSPSYDTMERWLQIFLLSNPTTAFLKHLTFPWNTFLWLWWHCICYLGFLAFLISSFLRLFYTFNANFIAFRTLSSGCIFSIYIPSLTLSFDLIALTSASKRADFQLYSSHSKLLGIMPLYIQHLKLYFSETKSSSPPLYT